MELFAIGNTQGAMRKVKDLIAMLIAANIAYTMTIQPDLVGIHPGNRSGCGVNPTDVACLLLSIFQLGWDPAFTNPLCVEVPSDPDAYSWVETFNAGLAGSSCGRIAGFLKGSIKFISL